MLLSSFRKVELVSWAIVLIFAQEICVRQTWLFGVNYAANSKEWWDVPFKKMITPRWFHERSKPTWDSKEWALLNAFNFIPYGIKVHWGGGNCIILQELYICKI